MKAGCYDLLSERFGLSQLDRNSHLFVSDTDVPDFPGRCFVIDKTTSMNKRELKEALGLPYEPIAVLAVGKGIENIELLEVGAGDDLRYFRRDGVHVVPKIRLSDLLL